MRRLLGAAALAWAATGCISQEPPVDTVQNVLAPTAISGGNTPATPTTPTTPIPTTPSTPATPAVAYVEDLQPIFQADCVRCHGGGRTLGNYSMSTYEQVLRAVTAGDARSRLVVTTRSNGSMYRYWSGDRAAKAELVRRWVVENGAARSR